MTIKDTKGQFVYPVWKAEIFCSFPIPTLCGGPEKNRTAKTSLKLVQYYGFFQSSNHIFLVWTKLGNIVNYSLPGLNIDTKKGRVRRFLHRKKVHSYLVLLRQNGMQSQALTFELQESNPGEITDAWILPMRKKATCDRFISDTLILYGMTKSVSVYQ